MILKAASGAGAKWAGKEVLRLPQAVAGLFAEWLVRNEPGKKDKVLSRVKSLRGGKLNDPRFGSRLTGEGTWADQISQLFRGACRKAALQTEGPGLCTAAFRRPAGVQTELF